MLCVHALAIICLFCGDLRLNVSMKEPSPPARACVIWLHGLGASADDMAGLANQLPLTLQVHHVFIDAPVRPVTVNNGMPMRAWYDITGMRLTDREDKAGILQSAKSIHETILQQIEAGFSFGEIFLAGFSQGGAMALFVGLRMPTPLAGIIALSAYLPLAKEPGFVNENRPPIFMAMGLHDPIVLPIWSRQTVEHLRDLGCSEITFHEYPMEHTVCISEMTDLALFITMRIEKMSRHEGVLK